MKVERHNVDHRAIAVEVKLCMSHTDADEPYEKRQKVLVDYGFRCECKKCQPASVEDKPEEEDLFGGDDEEHLFGADGDGTNDVNAPENNLGQNTIVAIITFCPACGYRAT